MLQLKTMNKCRLRIYNAVCLSAKERDKSMKEKIYTIPVNDAFDKDCECPVCAMFQELEKNAVEYTMGPSYMEDDIRAKTDELGFCQKHLQQVYDCENRLGFALVIKTHMDKLIADIDRLSKEPVKGKTFFKKAETPSVSAYVKKHETSCFVCEKINGTFDRYIDTILHLYKADSNFKKKYKESKGFCTSHFGLLIQRGQEKFSGELCEEFIKDTTGLYLENIKRVRDDVEWFINKFDHKYANESWKNAKDSLPRAMTKVDSVLGD